MKKTLEQSIYEQIGFKGMMELLWKTLPFPEKIISMPYSMIVYKEVLEQCHSQKELEWQHDYRENFSRVFKVLMPDYKKVKKHLLIKYEIL